MPRKFDRTTAKLAQYQREAKERQGFVAGAGACYGKTKTEYNLELGEIYHSMSSDPEALDFLRTFFPYAEIDYLPGELQYEPPEEKAKRKAARQAELLRKAHIIDKPIS